MRKVGVLIITILFIILAIYVLNILWINSIRDENNLIKTEKDEIIEDPATGESYNIFLTVNSEDEDLWYRNNLHVYKWNQDSKAFEEQFTILDGTARLAPNNNMIAYTGCLESDSSCSLSDSKTVFAEIDSIAYRSSSIDFEGDIISWSPDETKILIEEEYLMDDIGYPINQAVYSVSSLSEIEVISTFESSVENKLFWKNNSELIYIAALESQSNIMGRYLRLYNLETNSSIDLTAPIENLYIDIPNTRYLQKTCSINSTEQIYISVNKNSIINDSKLNLTTGEISPINADLECLENIIAKEMYEIDQKERSIGKLQNRRGSSKYIFQTSLGEIALIDIDDLDNSLKILDKGFDSSSVQLYW